MQAKGKFISFEGCDGSGKSTQIKLLSEYLTELNIEHVLTREPGGTETAEKIRNFVFSHNDEELLPFSEALMIYAARYDHVHKLIKPKLAQGVWVLCDRFFDSSFTYQGYGYEKIPVEKLFQLNELTLNDFAPDITLLLDFDYKAGLSRSLSRAEEQNHDEVKYENFDIEFHKRVADGYKLLAKKYPSRYRTIDASGDIKSVFNVIKNNLEANIRNYQNG